MAWFFISSLAFAVVFMVGMAYWADRTSATGVTKRLAKRGLPYRVRVSKDDEAWDPSKHNRWEDSYSLEGPGVAIYSLDLDARVVEVEWQVGGADPVRRSGPVPDHCLPMLARTGHRISAAGWVALVYVIASVAGLEIGYATSGPELRDEMAIFGGVAGFILAYIVMSVGVAVASSRRK